MDVSCRGLRDPRHVRRTLSSVSSRFPVNIGIVWHGFPLFFLLLSVSSGMVSVRFASLPLFTFPLEYLFARFWLASLRPLDALCAVRIGVQFKDDNEKKRNGAN